MNNPDPKPRRGEATRAAILSSARERFASDGYERATIRAIAADAGIDPALVMRYFGNKEGLFAAAAEIDLRLPDLAALPRKTLGSALAEHFLLRSEDDEILQGGCCAPQRRMRRPPSGCAPSSRRSSRRTLRERRAIRSPARSARGSLRAS